MAAGSSKEYTPSTPVGITFTAGPCSIAASVILIPEILFTRLSHSRPSMYPGHLVDFATLPQTKIPATPRHLLSYPLELRRGTSAPSGRPASRLDVVQLPRWKGPDVPSVEWPEPCIKTNPTLRDVGSFASSSSSPPLPPHRR